MAAEETSSKEILCYGFNQVRSGEEQNLKFLFIRYTSTTSISLMQVYLPNINLTLPME